MSTSGQSARIWAALTVAVFVITPLTAQQPPPAPIGVLQAQAPLPQAQATLPQAQATLPQAQAPLPQAQATLPPARVVVLDPALNAIVAPGAAIERWDMGYGFVEGPVWTRDGALLFSDIPGNTIFRTTADKKTTVFRKPSGYDAVDRRPGQHVGSNGLTLDRDGRVIVAEHGNRRVSRGDGAVPDTLVDRFEGARLNSPNDAVMRRDGILYFTDPPFGIQDNQRELAFMGTFRVLPGGAITTVRRGALTERPNGIALAPGGDVLYVGDAAGGLIRAYDLDAVTGVASGERTFTTTASTPDGLAVDTAGNLFVATADGIEAFAPDGSRWGAIAFPEQPANAGFGGADHRTLFITARPSRYRVRLTTPGLPLN
jgi:gluconolactonase